MYGRLLEIECLYSGNGMRVDEVSAYTGLEARAVCKVVKKGCACVCVNDKRARARRVSGELILGSVVVVDWEGRLMGGNICMVRQQAWRAMPTGDNDDDELPPLTESEVPLAEQCNAPSIA